MPLSVDTIRSTLSAEDSRTLPSFFQEMVGSGVPVTEQRMEKDPPISGLLVDVKLVMTGTAVDIHVIIVTHEICTRVYTV